jgi:phosphoglycolate phosphatase
LEPDVQAALLDFDGTLADSFPAITASTNHVRGLHHLPPMSESEIRHYVGFGLQNLIATLLPGVPHELAIAQYRDHHPEVMVTGTQLLPGVLDTLTELHQQGVALAVCSNKAVAFTRQLVNHLGLGELIPVVLGPDDVDGRAKPDPAMLLEAIHRLGVQASEAVYVGDMAVDVDAARAAGIPCAIVLGGAIGHESPVERKPEWVFDTFSQLLQLLGRDASDATSKH